VKTATVCGLVCLLCLILESGAAEATTYVVHPDGTGDFPTIQDAVNAVVTGDVIELSNGTFTGNGNRDVSFLGKAITIRSQGGAANCIVNAAGSTFDLHVGFRFESDEGATSVLQGVTVRGGNPTGLQVSSSPIVRDCVITDNHDAGYHTTGDGGGIACGLGAPYFIGCTISNNSASSDGPESYGGGVYLNGSPTFEHCDFLSNGLSSAQSKGGNIYCSSASNPTFLDCTIDDGRAALGAGVYCVSPTATFTRCVISDNIGPVMPSFGGGVYCRNAGATFSRCIFSNNAVANDGGGMRCEDSWVHLTNCTFYGNLTEGAGGGIALAGYSTAAIENTIISFSTYSEAISCLDGSSATLTCCDLYGNAGGNWVGCIAGQAESNGNISLDPLFCNALNHDFGLDAGSPCRPFSPPNPGCDLIGALPVSCGSTPTVTTTWGRIKSGYR
jgi:hypothetical protein